jgi:DNA-binding MarR family transcriptional regulator
MAAESDYDALKLENQLCFPLYACSRSIVNLYTPFLKPLGLTYTQYIVFLVLWEQDGITVGELGAKLHLDNGTITPLLKKMQDKGYVTRERSKSDERVVIVSLTDEGRALREEAVKIPASIGQCVPLEPDETATLYELLYKVLGRFSS